VAKNGDAGKQIGALGGKKDNHPALGNVGKDAKGKGAPILDHKPAAPAPQNLKGRLPFGKGKGKG